MVKWHISGYGLGPLLGRSDVTGSSVNTDLHCLFNTSVLPILSDTSAPLSNKVGMVTLSFLRCFINDQKFLLQEDVQPSTL